MNGNPLIAVFAHATRNVATSVAESLAFRPFAGTLSVVQFETIEAVVWVLMTVVLIALTRGTVSGHGVQRP